MGKRKILKRSIALLGAIAITAVSIFSSNSPGTPMVQAAATQYYTKDSAGYRNVMYYGDWSTGRAQGYFNPDKIPADQLTHLNFAFLDFDRFGNLIWGEEEASVNDVVGIEGAVAGAANAGILSGIIDLRAKNPNLRIGVSVGGWAKSGDFSTVAKDPTTRKRLADNLAAFVKYAQMDFVDVDWEYPGNLRQPEYMDNHTNEGTPHASKEDLTNYIALMQQIRNSLDELSKEVSVPDYSHWDPNIKFSKYYELSAAISANSSVLSQGTDIKALFQICDFVNVMTYDTTGQWEAKTGHHTALKTNPDLGNLSVEATVDYLLSQGADASKIVIGCAFYTRGWQSVKKAAGDPDIAGLPGLGWSVELVTPGTNGYQGNSNGTPGRGADNYQPAAWGDGGYAAGIWPYYNMDDLKKRYPNLKYYYDSAAEAPYLYSENGAFFTFDDETSIAAKAAYVKSKGLGGLIAWMQSQDGETVAGSNVRNRLTTAMKKGLFGSSALPQYKQFPEGPDMGITYVYNKSTNTIDFNLKNKSALTETKNVLKDVEESYKTIFTPTLYIKLKPGSTLSAVGDFCSVEMAGDIAIIYLYEADDMIDPKETIKFSLKPSDQSSHSIDSIILTQRIVPTASEFYHKLLTWSPWEAVNYFETPTPKAIQPPTITVPAKTMEIGQTQQISINNPVKGAAYSYKSGNGKVAVVSPTGLITAKGGGVADIVCTMKTTNHTYYRYETITVAAAPHLLASTKTLIAGNSSSISVVNQPKNSTSTWKSSNTKIATVSGNGTIKAIRAGKARITCTVKSKYHTFTLSAAVNVTAAPTMSVKAKTIPMGKSYTLGINNKISKAAYKWVSGKKKVATVTSKGSIKAMSPGAATIYCQIKADGKTYTLATKIVVTGPALAKSTLTLKKGRTTQLKLVRKITGSKYTLRSAKASVAAVNSKGLVRGKKKGTTTIQVKITFPAKLKLKPLTLNTKIIVK